MNIALLGYGKMGKAIEAIAKDRGHHITLIIGRKTAYQLDPENIDVAIDFSVPQVATTHIGNCLEAGIPVVSGTTGWLDNFDHITAQCKKLDGAFLYASNFSVGVNLFFELNKVLARLMKGQQGYSIGLEEIHHTQKLDAPSGTAITLAKGILQESDYTDWMLSDDNSSDVQNETTIPITSKRIGTVPGTHEIEYQSTIDTISIKHEAHSRQGFALGAVVAAEWLVGKKGVFSMRDVLNIS